MKLELTEAVWLDERGAVSLVELAQCSGFTETELRDLVELGAFEPLEHDTEQWRFGARCITAARTAHRLRNDLELDVHGLAVVLSLLERVRELESEVQKVRAHLPRIRIG